MDNFLKLKSPFYKPTQYWYDPVNKQVWKLKLACRKLQFELPTPEEERAVRELNDLL